MTKAVALIGSLIALATAAQATPQSQDIHRAHGASQHREAAAQEQTIASADQANVTFGEAIEAALAETKEGATSTVAEPSGRFALQVSASGGAHALSLKNTQTAQTQSWSIERGAPQAMINETISQVIKASGQAAGDVKSGVGQLSDLGK